MKKLLLVVIILTTTSIFSQTDLNQNGLKTSVINLLSAADTQAKRYEIATIGYNSHHWQNGGLVMIELYQQYYETGYEKYIIEVGYGQGTDNISLPVIKLVESNGNGHSAKIVLGIASDIATSWGNFPNKVLPVFLDLKYYSKYKIKITYLQDKVDEVTELNQIKINQNPIGINIPDFNASTVLNNNIITSGVLRVSGDANHYIQNGNLGIGTISPDEKLTVKGKIHAQEVKVDMLGALVPDYVFANDYKLKSLHEVEEFIKQNSHLPEIPSAKEIEKNGLMLAEMNMSLLKKMEEMTLYMIEMKKENEILKKNQSKLEKRIENIENK